MYTVVEFNQASGRPVWSADIFDTLPEASEHMIDRQEQTKADGRGETFRLYELNEVCDGGEHGVIR